MADFDVEWDGKTLPPPAEPSPRRRRGRLGWWLVAAVALIATAVTVPLAVSRSSHHHSAGPTGRPTGSATNSAAPLSPSVVSCASLIGNANWDVVLSGPGCTMDGRTVARFGLTQCASGLRLYSIQSGGVGYWAITGVLFHQFGPDPANDPAYLVAYHECFNPDPAQYAPFGKRVLVEGTDGDAYVTLSLEHPTSARAHSLTVSVTVTCLLGAVSVDPSYVQAPARGADEDSFAPTTSSLPAKIMHPGETVHGRAVFDYGLGAPPKMIYWGTFFTNPLAYWL